MSLVLHLCGADTSTLTEQLQVHFLEICEAAFKYGQCNLCCCQQLQLYNKLSSTVDAIVDISIESGGTNVDGHNFSVYQGNGLIRPINCTVIENTANYNISLTWKHNNSNNVQTFSSGLKPDVYQMNEMHSQQLYINNPSDSDGGVYSCEFSIENATLLSKSFTLNVVGMYAAVLSVYQLHDFQVQGSAHGGRGWSGPIIMAYPPTIMA